MTDWLTKIVWRINAATLYNTAIVFRYTEILDPMRDISGCPWKNFDQHSIIKSNKDKRMSRLHRIGVIVLVDHELYCFCLFYAYVCMI